MAEHRHHHHRHHRDEASIFKERSLRWLWMKHTIERWLKIFLLIVAALMALAVAVVYTIN